MQLISSFMTEVPIMCLDWFPYNRVPQLGSWLSGHRRRVPSLTYGSRVPGPNWRVPGGGSRVPRIGLGTRVPDPGSHFSGMLFKAGNYFKKRDSDTGVFLWILGSFWEKLFSKTPPIAASVPKAKPDYIKVIFIVSEVFRN